MTRILRATRPAPARRRPPEATRVLRADQLRSLSQGDEILEGARQKAQALLDRAEAEAEALRQRADAEARTQAAALICRADQRAAQIVVEARAELTTLAVRVAEKILGEKLRLQPDMVCSIVEQCLRALPGSRHVRLSVNPDDLPRLQAALPRLGAAAGAALQLRADPQVAPGGCLLQSELGEVDGRLEVQLERLAEALR